MIARLEVTRGPLTEYPLAEKVRGGWQNGVTFYADDDVTKITRLRVSPEPQGEPSDAQVLAASNVLKELWQPHMPNWVALSRGTRAALRAAGEVK